MDFLSYSFLLLLEEWTEILYQKKKKKKKKHFFPLKSLLYKSFLAFFLFFFCFCGKLPRKTLENKVNNCPQIQILATLWKTNSFDNLKNATISLLNWAPVNKSREIKNIWTEDTNLLSFTYQCTYSLSHKWREREEYNRLKVSFIFISLIDHINVHETVTVFGNEMKWKAKLGLQLFTAKVMS